MDLYYKLIYHSRACSPISNEIVLEILEKSRLNNHKLGITGCLLFYNNEFLQILEGEKNTVINLYDKIKKDSRHKELEVIWEGNSEHKIFTNWDMAFKKISNVDFNKLSNYLEIENINELIDIFYNIILNVTEKEKVSRKLFSYISRELLML